MVNTGNRTFLKYPNGDKLTYSYDTLNRLIHIRRPGLPNPNIRPYYVSPYLIAQEAGVPPPGGRSGPVSPTGIVAHEGDGTPIDHLDTLFAIDPSGPLFRFAYDALSRRTELERLKTGLITFYAYDDLNRITAITNSANSPVGNITYPLYDNVGNRKEEINSISAPNAFHYSYDYNDRHELEAVSDQTPASHFTYTYDLTGNRLSYTEGGATATYTPNNLNQYDMVDAVTYTYDLKGNLTNDDTYTYVYDYENRLLEVKDGAATVSSYTYDPFGRRLSKTTDSETTLFIQDRDDILETYACDEDLTNCQFTRNYIYSDRIDEPLSFGISNPVYYHHDALGNTVTLTDKNGNLKETYQYDPYGKPHFFNASGELIPSSTLNNPYLFTGREYDPETQLYYYRARYYSSRIGRFMQRDPLAQFPDIDFFQYRGHPDL